MGEGNILYFHCGTWLYDCIQLPKLSTPVLLMDIFYFMKLFFSKVGGNVMLNKMPIGKTLT